MEPLHKKYLTEQRLKLQERQARGETGLAVAGRHASFIDVFIISVFNSLEIRGSIGVGARGDRIAWSWDWGDTAARNYPLFRISISFFFIPRRSTPGRRSHSKDPLPPLGCGYDVGYTVQSMDDCLDMARSEPHFLTALLDARRITGNPALALALKTRIKDPPQTRAGPEVAGVDAHRKRETASSIRRLGFFPGTAPERRAWRASGSSISCFGSGRPSLRPRTFALWKKYGYLSWEDRRHVDPVAQNFLLRLRNQLHYLAGRKTDQLSFEFQEAMAEWEGITARGNILPVEVFMRDVYRHLQSVQTIHQNFFERLTEQSQTGDTPRRDIEPGIFLGRGPALSRIRPGDSSTIRPF